MGDQFEFEKELAIKNMRAGVIAGLVIFGVMLGKVLIAQFSQINHPSLVGLDDPWAIGDLVLVFLLIWGITRYSRFCALTLFLYYLSSQVIQFLETGSFLVLIISFLFLFLFARAIKGAFDYHKLMKGNDNNYKPTKKWMWWLGTPTVLLLGFFMTIGLLSKYEIIPVSYVKSIQDITAKDLQTLREINLINIETEVKSFYSYGLFSIREGGVFMTDTELVIYMEDSGEIFYDSLGYQEIDWVKQLGQGSEFEDALYQVAGKEQYKGFQFLLSIENNGHTVFIQDLNNKINPPLPKIEIPLPEIELPTFD